MLLISENSVSKIVKNWLSYILMIFRREKLHNTKQTLSLGLASLSCLVAFVFGLMAYLALFRYAGVVMSPETQLSANLAWQQSQEKLLVQKAEQVLEKIVGKNNAQVQINLLVDFDKTVLDEEHYDPDSRVIRSRYGSEFSENVQYSVSKFNRYTLSSGGVVKKMYVAVVVDGSYALLDIMRMAELVKASIGFDDYRGDVFDIESLPFLVENPWYIVYQEVLCSVCILLLFLFVLQKICRKKMCKMADGSKNVDTPLTDLLENSPTVWQELNSLKVADLEKSLKKENQQTVALVLSKLNAAKAAEVIESFSAEEGAEIIGRIAVLKELNEDVLATVEETIREDISVSNKISENARHIVNIVNEMGFDKEEALLRVIYDINPTLGAEIKDSLFSFDDLLAIDAHGIVALLEQVDEVELALALRGAQEEVKKLFTQNMKAPQIRSLQMEMQRLGPVKLKDIEYAQRKIVSMVKKMLKTRAINLVAR